MTGICAKFVKRQLRVQISGDSDIGTIKQVLKNNNCIIYGETICYQQLGEIIFK